MEARDPDMETFPLRYIRSTAWFEVLSNVKRERSMFSVMFAKSVGCIDVRLVFLRGWTNASRKCFSVEMQVVWTHANGKSNVTAIVTENVQREL